MLGPLERPSRTALTDESFSNCLVIGLTGGIASGMSYNEILHSRDSSQLSLSRHFFRKVHRLRTIINAAQHSDHRRRLSRTRRHTAGNSRL